MSTIAVHAVMAHAGTTEPIEPALLIEDLRRMPTHAGPWGSADADALEDIKALCERSARGDPLPDWMCVDCRSPLQVFIEDFGGVERLRRAFARLESG